MKLKKEIIVLAVVMVAAVAYLALRKTDRTHFKLPELPPVAAGKITKLEVDLAVLATGMVPNNTDQPPPLDTTLDEYGFVVPDGDTGVIGAGVAGRPLDVAASIQDATGAALKAITTGIRR